MIENPPAQRRSPTGGRMNSVKELREAVTELVRLLDVVLRKDHFSRDDEDSFSWYEMKEKFNLNEENNDEA